MPDGPIGNLAGLKFTANGKTIPWRRDLVNMFAFHLDIPAGVESLDADFDFLLSAPAAGYSAGASATAYLDVLSWNQVLLYPQGYPAAELRFVPSLRIPEGWKFGTALPGPKENGYTVDFAPVPLNTLVDSPVLMGIYFRAIQLTPGKTPSHEIDIAADDSAALAMTPETQVHFHDLVEQAGALFGSRHYRDYHFLLTLSDHVAHFGLEDHESSDDRTNEKSLIDSDALTNFSGLLPHEFVHSWNGKYRRPADLVSTDYQQPMLDDLLWVYEGLTEYLGEVLTSRSGLWNPQQGGREEIARLASVFSKRPGRDWRPLQDTADSAVFLYGADAEGGGTAAQHGFLRRRRAAVAGRGCDAAPADERQKVARRFLPGFSWGSRRQARVENLHVRGYCGGAEQPGSLRLERFPADAPGFPRRFDADRGHRKQRLETGLQRQSQ